MARSDDDTWDLATSVGATATGVAVGRALASRAPDALINDPFAEPLVRAVGVDFFTRLASGELDPDAVDEGAGFGMARMTGMMAVRTRLIDDYFADAARQACARWSSWPPVWTHAPTACPGRRHHNLRDRSTRGHRVEDTDAARNGC